MKAVVYERYGSPEVLHFAEVDTPSPGPDEVLIRSRATTVSTGDWRARSLTMPRGFGMMGRLFFGIRKPRQPILGTELAGDVVAVGRDVTRFRPGDPVFAFPGAAMGCHAEFRCMREDGMLVAKPSRLGYDEAATLSFGGITALTFLRRGALRSGERVLVNGASGAVGSAAVQLARHFGAEVTGVCSTGNVELVRSLGAAHVVDYTTTDFSLSRGRYDVIVDTVGTAPFSRSGEALAKGGRLLLVAGVLSDLLSAPWDSMTSGKRIVAGPGRATPADLQLLADLAQAGELKPVIDRRYPFEQMVEAHRYVDTGRKRGSVVVTLGPGD